MPTEKDEVILDLSIDQGNLEKQLAASKRAIIETREEQAKLRKEYKDGAKDIDQYAEETVKLEKRLKEEQESYKNLTKAIQANSNTLEGQRYRLATLIRERSKLDKSTKEGSKQFEILTNEIKKLNDEIGKHEQASGNFSRNVGNYKQSIIDASKEINVGGASISGLTDNILKFANPATAAIGLITGITSAYKSSVAGARDYDNATTQLSTAFQILNNRLSETITKTGGRGGRGPLASAARFFTELFTGKDVSFAADAVARINELIGDLGVSLINAQAFAKQAEKQAEDARRIRDDQEADLQERLKQTKIISDQLAVSEGLRVTVLKQELTALTAKAKLTKTIDDPSVKIDIANKEREILDIQEEVNGKLTENVTARREILKLLNEEQEFQRQKARDTGQLAGVELKPEGSAVVDQARIDAEQQENIQRGLSARILKFQEEQYFAEVRLKRETEEKKRALDEQGLAATGAILDQASALSEQNSDLQKFLSTTSAIIKTYEAANVALASAPPPFSYALAAITIAAGLANVAKINEFAEGGYTGAGGKYQPAGIVHKGEVVWNQQDVASVGGPTIANMMRPTSRSRNSTSFGYQDGGIVTGSLTQPVDTQLMTSNMIKNLPNPEVSVKEFTKVQRRVQVKESIAKT